ncbi:unnamed protein product [Larinioides sclopetarius]|uniref:Ribosomal protein L20 n=1 Tax=Larinioides sclopetarius TaxID=280406 RepID=A0AAV2B3I4_9ARAC
MHLTSYALTRHRARKFGDIRFSILKLKISRLYGRSKQSFFISVELS